MFILENLLTLLLFLIFCWSFTTVSADLMNDLYRKYISAVSNDNFTISARRLLTKNREYEIHVKKLKEVNGYKKHNLFVKESLRFGLGDPYIYINNPVESKVPKAYLTLEEFKNALTNRVIGQKNEFTTKTKKKRINIVNKMLVSNTYKTKPIGFVTNSKRTVLPKKVNLKVLTNKNRDIINNKTLNNNTTKINNNNVLNTVKTIARDKTITTENNKELKIKTTISDRTISTENDKVLNTIHENIVRDSEKITENNITSDFSKNISEFYKNETEKCVNSQEIILDTTKPITENTKIQNISNSESIIIEEISDLDLNSTLLTNVTTAVFDTINTEILTTTENVATTETLHLRVKPRRKKTEKSFSVSTKKRRSTLGRPLVFIGNR